MLFIICTAILDVDNDEVEDVHGAGDDDDGSVVIVVGVLVESCCCCWD